MKNLSIYSILLFFIFHLPAQTLNQKFYLDFGKSDGTNGNITDSADNNGNYWNNIVSDESGSPSIKEAGYTVTLKNSENQNTEIILETTTFFKANGIKNGALTNPNPSLLGDLAVETATQDYFFIDDTHSNKGAFVFKNLDPGKAYKFYVFGCRAENDVRTSIYSISGINGSHGIQQTTGLNIGTEVTNGNDNNIFESGYVVPKANGEIMFELGILNGGFAYINAMKIEEYTSYTLPAVERKFYIDFGKNNNGLDGNQTIDQDINGNYWNNMYSNGDGATTEGPGKSIDIVFSDNSESGYTVELGSNFEFNGVRNGALTNPDPALLGDLAIATATHDYLFIASGIPLGVLHFKNLDTDKVYRFSIFGSRSDTDVNRIGIINLAGSNSITGIHHMGGLNMCGTGVNQNDRNIFVSDIITPGSDGLITLELTKWLGGYAHINAMKVEEIHVDVWAEQITISGNDITSCGQTTQMSVKTTPADAFCPPIQWSVDNNEIAEITESGKLYPKQNGTVKVTATALFGNGNSITDTKEITITNQNIDDYSIAIMGSSVSNGQGADSGKGYAHLLADLLSTSGENPWSVTNISVPGNNTTDVLNRWESDLLSTCSRYVYYGLSLGNEGIREKGREAFDSYHDNMLILIEQARAVGKIPVVGNNYPRTDFNSTDYDYVKKLNLLIHEWDVPSVNLLGAIDNGSGQWASGYWIDNAHPNTMGHAEMFYVIVPSLFDALAAGKPQPEKIENTSISLEKTDKARLITWVPENVLHSFTLTFSFKTASQGTLASFISGNTSYLLKINDEGKLMYGTTSKTDKFISVSPVNDGEWHQVSLTHYNAWGRTLMYVDGIQAEGYTVYEKLVPEQFYLNDAEYTLESVDFSELFFYRAAMNAEEIQALYEGKMLKSSLEIYAPLNGEAGTEEEMLENFAQNLNTLAIEEKDFIESSIKEIDDNDFENFREISIYTTTGKRVVKVNDPSLLISIKELPTGVYIARMVKENGNVLSKKIIID